MLIRRNSGWEMRESAATPEAVFLDRRRLLKALAAGSMLAPRDRSGVSARRLRSDPSAGLYPVKRNPTLHARPADHRREIFDELQ